MEYINKVNWKRTNRKYYRVFIHYTDNYGYKRRVTCNYNVSQNIKKTSKLGRILKLRADTRLSLFQIKKILSDSNYKL